MSEEDLRAAFRLIERHSDMGDFEGPKPAHLLQEVEDQLAVRLPGTYRRFLERYGCGDIAGEEFYGIINGDSIHSSIPDAVWMTLKHRKESGLPRHLVVVYATGDGSYYALDTSQESASGECPVVVWNPGTSGADDRLEIVAEDFGKFIYAALRDALNSDAGPE